MVRKVFYSDDTLEDLEIVHRWYESLQYLEDRFFENEYNVLAEEIVATLIFQSWYIITYLPNTSLRYIIFEDYDYYIERWRNYISWGLCSFYNSANVCWMIGYTLTTCNLQYKHLIRFGEDMKRRGIQLAVDEHPWDILSGRRRRNKNDEFIIIPSKLFPSKSAADTYFKTLLSEAGITD